MLLIKINRKKHQIKSTNYRTTELIRIHNQKRRQHTVEVDIRNEL